METSHGGTQKRFFISKDDLPNALTQIAYGTFQMGESCPMHKHQTMDEYFYFIKGHGTYLIDDEVVETEPCMLVNIPAESNHQLLANKNESLEFIYWGVAKTN
ncbi:MAG: cupin domain-containing protein [Flavobacteriales bacterium]|nr:cupin domain-containing protein [Flavobacteriales bacterium]